MGDVIEEYLVSLSAQIDRGGFSEFQQVLDRANRSVLNLRDAAVSESSALSGLVKGFGVLASALSAVGVATGKLLKDTADQDMQYQIMAKNMWTTTQNAKELTLALNTMGKSMEDVAWIPELREQFSRLREEAGQFGPPAEFYQQMRQIRQMSYEWQSFMMKFKLLKEWVAYYLMKYLAEPLEKIGGFLRDMNQRFGLELPAWGNRIARVLTILIHLGMSLMRFGRDAYRAVRSVFDLLPEGARKFIAFATVIGLAFKANPVIAALSLLILLIDDFYAYLDGRKSSKTFAPLWKALIGFWQKASVYLDKVRTFLGDIRDGIAGDEKLQAIWGRIKETWSDAVRLLKTLCDLFIYLFGDMDVNGDLLLMWQAAKSIAKGILDIFDALIVLVDKFLNGTPVLRSFFKAFVNGVEGAIRLVARLGTLVGRLFSAIAKALRGDFKGALADAGSAVQNFVRGQVGGATDDARSDRAQHIMSRLVGVGYTPEQAAGIVGNLIQESNLDTYARSKDGHNSVGIGQWTDDREQALYAFAASAGRDPYDLETQIDFLIHELQTSEAYANRRLLENSSTPSEAAMIFGREFERPNEEYANWENRTSKAETTYDEYHKRNPALPPIAGNTVARSAASGKYWNMHTSNYMASSGGNISIGAINVNAPSGVAPMTAADLGREVGRALRQARPNQSLAVRQIGGVVS